MSTIRTYSVFGGLLAVGALLAWPSAAAACGGLFCSAASPVNQAAERIIFSQAANGTTTAVIEIQYQGPSTSFSWVLPVPGVPEVGLSSKQALDRLQAQTDPQYSVRTDYGNCPFPDFGVGGADAGVLIEESTDAGAVHVLASGSVGPYDFTVLQIDSNAAQPVQLMLDWLTTNGYDVSLLGEDLLGEYVAEGMNFLAVRLSKSADTGSIRPVMITYQSDRPVIPIRPTAVAANPDMGVMTWVLGSSRAIPSNYRGLELNEALIDWFNPFSTYNQVVIEAANEAGGHGFVTEHADAASTIANLIWFPAAQDARDELDQDLTVDDLLMRATQSFGTLDGYVDVVRRTVPLTAGVTPEEFVDCAFCYFDSEGLGSFNDGGAFNKAEFLAALDDLVVNPMKQTQALFDNADYTTRLYTTLSADEMTVDPEFDFNPDLANVSNVHRATQVFQCGDGGQSWTVELPSGVVIAGFDPFTWPIQINSGLPFNQKVLQFSTSGPADVITNNEAIINAMISGLSVPHPVITGNPNGTDGSASGPGTMNSNSDGGIHASSNVSAGSSDCGCSVPGSHSSSPTAPLLSLGLAALLASRRRRKY